jgi:tetratricopeptide (TPR) repeat protein
MGPFFLFDSYDCFKVGKTDASPYLNYAKDNRLELFVIEGPKNLIFNENDIRVQKTYQTNIYSHYYPDSLHPKYMNLDELRLLAEKGNKIQSSENSHDDVFDEKSMIIESLNLQGMYSLENGKYWDAISWFDNALEHDPENRDALYNKALALEVLGLDDDAKIIFDRLSENTPSIVIPDWIRNNAKWWAEGSIGDSDFTTGIQFLVKEKIITIPETGKTNEPTDGRGIPSWIKNNAEWWSQGLISDDDFVKGIQFLIESGIIVV